MTAFDQDILAGRKRRQGRVGFAKYLAGRATGWMIAIAATLLVVFVIGGFAEAAGGDSAFRMPWDWLPAVLNGSEPMARWTGVVLTLFLGGWLATIGLKLCRLLLSLDIIASTAIGSVFTVARAGLDEAVRNRTVVVLLGLMLVALSVQPYLTLGTIEHPLRDTIRFTLSYSGFIAALFLGGVTIFLATSGVASDFSARRAGSVFVKPVPRWGYLLGRWLGTVVPMAVLVIVWAVVTLFISTVWLNHQTALDIQDRDFISNQVLVARAETEAQPDESLQDRVRDRVMTLRETDPDRVARRGEANLVQDLLNEERLSFLALQYDETKSYRFPGLGEVRQRALALEAELKADAQEISDRLKEINVDLKPNAVTLASVLPFGEFLDLDLSQGQLQLQFSVRGSNTYGSTNGVVSLEAAGAVLTVNYLIDRVQTYSLPATFIDEDGTLELSVKNRGFIRNDTLQQVPIQFEADTWLSIFSVRGDFGGNVLRQAILLWTRLCFLAMLATVAASVMSFPVATTLSLALWTLAAGGTWLQRTLQSGVGRSGDNVAGSAFEMFLVPIAQGLAWLMSGFSKVDGISRLSQGLYLSWNDVLYHVLTVGLLWTAIAFAVGWVLFSRREIARVQV